MGAKTLSDIRLAGISSVDDLVADALLNPHRAKLLLSKPMTRANETATMQMLGQLYRRSVAVSGGNSLTSNGDQDEGDGSLQVTIATGRR